MRKTAAMGDWVPKEFIRALGAHERLLYLYSKRHPRHFCIVVEYDFAATRDEFADALLLLQYSFPVLAVCIKEYQGIGPSLVKTDQPIACEFREDAAQCEWRAVVAAELSKAFPTDSVPLLRATAIARGSRTTVTLTAHHSVVDALSVVAFAERLGQLLLGQTPPPSRLYGSMERYLPRARPVPVDEGQMSDIAARLRAQSTKPIWRPFRNDRVHVFEHQFDRKLTEEIRQTCRWNGTTVQGALCAALALAIGRTNGQDQATLLSPVNLRAEAGLAADAVGLFVCANTVTLAAGNGHDFWSMARSVSRGLKALRSGGGAAELVGKLEDIIKPDSDPALAAGLVGSYSYDAVVSNLGQIATDNERRCGIESVRGPFVLGRLNDERMIGASSFDGILRVTQASPVHMDNVLPEVARHLSSLDRY
jgi:hypothetical protein